jgi:hypothetical protein
MLPGGSRSGSGSRGLRSGIQLALKKVEIPVQRELGIGMQVGIKETFHVVSRLIVTLLGLEFFDVLFPQELNPAARSE